MDQPMTGLASADLLASRLAALRAALSAAGLAGWIVGREDMYQGGGTDSKKHFGRTSKGD